MIPRTSTEVVLAQVRDSKQFRKDLDAVLQRLKDSSSRIYDPVKDAEGDIVRRPSRERSLAITKIEEAIMWLGMDLKAISEANPGVCENPYPQSKNPDSPVVEKTADGLKL